MTDTTSGLTTRPKTAPEPFELGEKVTGRSLLNDTDVTGTWLRPTGEHGEGLLIDCGDGSRDVITTATARRAKATLADSLRQFADLIDQHPEIGAGYSFPGLTEHQTGRDAANVDPFAKALGIAVEAHENKESGRSFTIAETYIGVLHLKLQAYTDDYEQARAERERQLIAEAEHSSKTPMPIQQRDMHIMSETCWCGPQYSGDGLAHRNEDGSEPVFAATDADPIDANGYPTEDHR